MGLFRRKINNTAASALPAPAPVSQTVHHHSTNWPGIIIAATIAAVIGLIAMWLFLVFLFGQLGYRRPGYEAAWWLLFIAILAVCTWIAGQLIIVVSDHIIRAIHVIVIDVQKEVTERKRLELLAIQSSVDPGRMTETEYQFAQVVLAVMNESYSYLDKNKAKVFKGRGRPWSIDSVLSMAKAMGIEMTQKQAGEVKRWLRDNDVVIGALDGQVNVGKYDNLGLVRALLDSKFGRPITVTKYPPLRENWGYEHI